MRHDPPAREFLEADARDKTRPMKQPTLDVETLRVLVDCRTRRAHQHARREPIRERLLGGGIAVRFAPEFEPDNIVGAPLVKLILARGADQIVRRRDHASRFTYDFAIVKQRAEGLDTFAGLTYLSCSPASTA